MFPLSIVPILCDLSRHIIIVIVIAIIIIIVVVVVVVVVIAIIAIAIIIIIIIIIIVATPSLTPISGGLVAVFAIVAFHFLDLYMS